MGPVELTAIATSGATALVTLMATDAWTGARSIVANAFRRGGESASQTEEMLEASRAHLLTERSEAVVKSVEEFWATEFLKVLLLGNASDEPLIGALRTVASMAGEGEVTQTITAGDSSVNVQAGHRSQISVTPESKQRHS